MPKNNWTCSKLKALLPSLITESTLEHFETCSFASFLSHSQLGTALFESGHNDHNLDRVFSGYFFIFITQ